MLSPIWNKFVEWLFKEENRPFLFPRLVCIAVIACYVAVIPAYLIIEKHSVRLLLECFFDYRLLLGGGILLVLVGAICAWQYQAKRRMIVGAAPLVALGVIVVAAGVLTRPILPEDKLVVAIIRFTPIGKAAEEKEAGVFPSRIRDELRQRFKNEPLVNIKFFQDVTIEGHDEEEMRRSAERLCSKLPAHMVVWGEVRIEDGVLTLAPVVTRSPQLIAKTSRLYPWLRVSAAHTPLDPFKKPESYEPPHIQFKKIMARETADLAGFICGLIYYQERRLQEAIAILRRVKATVALLYLGMAHYERSWQSKEPMKDLIAAREIYDKILRTNANSEPQLLSRQELLCSALAAKADTLAGLSEFHRPDSLDLLREAIGIYQNSQKELSDLNIRVGVGCVRNNLGLALLSLGSRLGDQDGKILLNKALEELQAAQDIFRQTQSMARAAFIESYKGLAFSELAYRTTAPSGKQLFLDAVAAHRRASDLFGILRLSEEQAMADANLGGALVTLSEWQDVKSAKETLSRARITLLTALDTLTVSEFPRYHAGVQMNVGALYCHMGLRSNRTEALNYFEKSVTALSKALNYFSAPGFPQYRANTQNLLGITVYQSSKLLEGENRLIALQKAEVAWRDALAVWTSSTNPREWAAAQNNLGNALRHIGTATTGTKSEEMLRQAIAAYLRSLKIRTFEVFPWEWAMTENNLALAYLELGKKATGEVAGHNFAKAIKAFKRSLLVRTRETFPDEWAWTTKNMALSMVLNSMRLDDAQSKVVLKDAIDKFGTISSLFSRTDEPGRWATAQNDLGCALAELGKRLDPDAAIPILQEAILALKAALEVRTRDEHPLDWAATMTNLAISLNTMATKLSKDSSKDRRRKCQQESLKAYESSLSVYSEARFPEAWANTKAFMGRGLIGLSMTDDEEAQAIQHLNTAVINFKEALRIWTEKRFPKNWADTEIALGMAQMYRATLGQNAECDLDEAIETFEKVITSPAALKAEEQLHKAEELRELAVKAKSTRNSGTR